MSNIKKTTKEIEKAIADSKKKKEEIRQRIMAARASVISAKQEMDIAAASDDEKAFFVASDKVRFNESVIAANEAKLVELEKEQKESVTEMVKQVRKAQSEIATAAEADAAAAVYDIFLLATKAQADIKALEKQLTEYANEVGDVGNILPYPLTGELDKMLNEIRASKKRTDRFGNGSVLYANIS